MQNTCKRGYLYVALIVIVLMGGSEAACSGTVGIENTKNYVGSPVVISGTASDDSELFLNVCDIKTGECINGSVMPISGVWQYIAPSSQAGMKNIIVWDNSYMEHGKSCGSGVTVVRPASEKEPVYSPATDTRTPQPTPDYTAEIETLERKIAEQENQIEAIGALPKPTTPTPTPIPTATIDHAATIAVLEKQIADHDAELYRQKGWIEMILSFLGLA